MENFKGKKLESQIRAVVDDPAGATPDGQGRPVPPELLKKNGETDSVHLTTTPSNAISGVKEEIQAEPDHSWISRTWMTLSEQVHHLEGREMTGRVALKGVLPLFGGVALVAYSLRSRGLERIAGIVAGAFLFGQGWKQSRALFATSDEETAEPVSRELLH